jgi:hypothetical protein
MYTYYEKNKNESKNDSEKKKTKKKGNIKEAKK